MSFVGCFLERLLRVLQVFREFGFRPGHPQVHIIVLGLGFRFQEAHTPSVLIEDVLLFIRLEIADEFRASGSDIGSVVATMRQVSHGIALLMKSTGNLFE
ncbi:hypothetical protein RP75_06065 [Agrobacterium arsenijevicii]|uniref:Uncharacterized protein n=1 Tax=Agrobacterium arsenijevicii TaxID=1585697 RepID=A0ABR5DC38_9HYPH|nr:hypothetical protein RP75_06065 [Agrobacterium arsenijevicii]